jgi:effector-binding domain-containing protein
MKVLITILKVIGIIVLLLLIVSLFLPASVHVERSVTINAKPEAVFAHIGDLKKWEPWSPWKKKDPNMQNTFEGAEGAVGQKSIWKSEHPKVGNGSMTITEIKPNELLVTSMDFGMGDAPKGIFKLEPVGSDSTKLTWAMDADGKGLAWYMKPMSKYFNLMMDGMIGPDFEEGLAGIKTIAESTPAATSGDLSSLTFTVEEVMPKETFALAAPANKIKVEQAEAYLGKYFPLLMASAKRYKLVAGHPIAVYHFWDGKETNIEAVLPVDSFSVDKNYEFPTRKIGGGKALKIDYWGDYSKMEKAHTDMDTYAKAKGLKINGSPWEVYITDPMTEKDTAKWHTEIYYPIE